MTPLSKIYLNQSAGAPSRIGTLTRTTNDAIYRDVETMLEVECPLAITCDVRPIHPPYFTEFCYVDVMGGLLLSTLSAEINWRMSDVAVNCASQEQFDLGKVMDKYALQKPKRRHRKVAFLPGSNFTSAIDQCHLQRLMQDDEWVIKLHPLTRDEMIRELASIYGYHRLIDPAVSGMAVLREAEEVAATSTSELFIIARLMGKPVANLTRADRDWITTYGHIVRHIDNTDGDVRRINNLLMSKYSGYLRPEYPDARNRRLATAYFSKAMELRETWRPISNQRLVVADKTFLEWNT